jgi:hypothetical protein
MEKTILAFVFGLIVSYLLLSVKFIKTDKGNDLIKITKILVDQNLDSYFEDVEIPTSSVKPLGKYSAAFKVKDMYFRNSIKGIFELHPAPQKQYIVYLSGKAEITTSKGITKVFRSGDILLAEDINGRGHKSTILEEGKVLIITVAGD